MRVLLAALLTAGLALAGCVTPSTLDTASVDPVDGALAASYEAAMALLAGVPCEATSVPERATSDNLLDLGVVTYDETQHGEIDIRGKWLLAARYAGGGIDVVSLADPVNPVYATLYQSEAANAQDVKWMPDGRTAVVGINQQIDLVDIGPVMDSTVPVDQMMDADVYPTLISTWEYPGGALFTNMHMVTTARISDVDYVFVAPNDDTGYWVLKLVGEGAQRKLETVGNYGAPLGGGPLGPHDMSLVWDGFTEKPILYVANGFEGWLAYDVSDPANPVQLAVMPNLGAAQGYTHTVLGQKVGDRRIVVTISEVGPNLMSVFDATDFRTPILLAQWWADKTNPATPQHNIQIVNGTLFLAHYTYGVYAFDLAKVSALPLVGTATIAPFAHYMPLNPEDGGTLGFANIWDVVVHNGLLYINDSSHGTAVVGFGCMVPGDVTATSTN